MHQNTVVVKILKMDEQKNLLLVKEFSIRDDDSAIHTIMLQGAESLSPREVDFVLRDNKEYAKRVNCGSVITPFAILPSGEVQLTKTKKTSLGDGYYVEIDVVPTPLPKEQSNTTCSQCKYFSKDKGKEVLKTPTHKFADGEVGLGTEAIVDAMASMHKLPTLSKANVGYCSFHSRLCALHAPACSEFEPIKSE